MVDWQSKRIRRVARSTTSAEIAACIDGMDAALFTQKLLQELLGFLVPIVAFVDGKALVDAVNSTKTAQDK